MNKRFCILCANFTGKRILLNFSRNESRLVRSSAELDESVSNELDNNLKPRRHPGVMNHKPVSLPEVIKKSISNLLAGEVPKKQMLCEAQPLERYLMARQVPVEKAEFFDKRLETMNEVRNSLEIDIESLPQEEQDRWNKSISDKVDNLLKKKLYSWNQIDFTNYMSQLYLVTRSAAEYAVVYKIFQEICKRTNFVPNTVFDFGSGMGSVIWAANSIWGSSVKEYFCVDSSSHMNSLSEQILKRTEPDIMKRIFYRQFLPSSSEITSDLVISSYSLLELSSKQNRLDTLINLWKRTGKYLVLIEFGSEGGFKVLNEARTAILHHVNKGKTFENEASYIFAPCPHHNSCPRSDDKCFFEASYTSFPQKPEHLRKEYYSYVVFAKGERHEKVDSHWPRIVQPVLCRSRHVICRLCSSSGNMKEVIITPSKHGKKAYRCAKASRWGDLFPFKLKPYEKSPTEKKD
ncbi:unnamed protein product [Nezara viridula]|uniref:Methyltransferase-like protein 17, mitochondrial n=1 Tax=Nezara viridula TaxID=85310 RepID=A0A9P0GYP8_NEZVI|nr:unnamed protein product [Nezara viridula]